MPARPPKQWWDECVSGVRSRGGAISPERVCGKVWSRKTLGERIAATLRSEGPRRGLRKVLSGIAFERLATEMGFKLKAGGAATRRARRGGKRRR